ncbi:MAG: hypothetical protein M0R18_01500 [Deltaproteobacteria bacterium]|jgi:hypothetical protein|nr:hypothetical protein [Deltaproteobacteria bacterium]
MMTRALLILVAILLTPTLAADQVPHDAELLRRTELCAHFRQEPWPEGKSAADIERREFIVNRIEEFCTDLPEATRNLRDKYLDDPSIISKLNKAKK